MADAVFVDIETTGLDPVKDEICEFAIALVDTDTWKFIKAHTGLVYTDGLVKRMEADDLPEVVKRMHVKSGLWTELQELHEAGRETSTYEQVDQAILDLVKGWSVKGEPIWGSSVHFDRKFMEQKFPLTNEYFHYRIIDSSSDMMRLRNRRPDLWKKIDEDETRLTEGVAHRALADIGFSVDTERLIEKWVTGPAAACAGLA